MLRAVESVAYVAHLNRCIIYTPYMNELSSHSKTQCTLESEFRMQGSPQTPILISFALSFMAFEIHYYTWHTFVT